MKGWLTGWKAISNYIDRSIKTAKKYHNHYGMPVLRGPGGIPLVIMTELDKWIILYDTNRKKLKKTPKIPQNFLKNVSRHQPKSI